MGHLFHALDSFVFLLKKKMNGELWFHKGERVFIKQTFSIEKWNFGLFPFFYNGVKKKGNFSYTAKNNENLPTTVIFVIVHNMNG